MLTFQDFFTACTGLWITERTYHSMLENEIERSHTEFRVHALDGDEKQQILSGVFTSPSTATAGAAADAIHHQCPGFAIAFDTVSEKGEQVSMQLKALFVPDECALLPTAEVESWLLPTAAQVNLSPASDVIRGFYLRDEGYSEAGAIAGRFTYQPTRQTLEMTTYYKRSVAVDQMRFIAPDLRLRTIVTYQRPPEGEMPTLIKLVGFGVEHKHPG
ncbi:MAG TPA: phycobiliprotein lyase [Chroococcidiopsis sp.]